jgi:hypothetical protein
MKHNHAHRDEDMACVGIAYYGVIYCVPCATKRGIVGDDPEVYRLDEADGCNFISTKCDDCGKKVL